MPALAFLGVASLVLLVLLFVANGVMPEGSPPIVTSSQIGLPERWHSDDIQVLTRTPAPEPDMASPAIRAVQPSPDHEVLFKLAPTARAARAEAAPARDRATRSNGYRETNWGDRFSIGNQ